MTVQQVIISWFSSTQKSKVFGLWQKWDSILWRRNSYFNTQAKMEEIFVVRKVYDRHCATLRSMFNRKLYWPNKNKNTEEMHGFLCELAVNKINCYSVLTVIRNNNTRLLLKCEYITAVISFFYKLSKYLSKSSHRSNEDVILVIAKVFFPFAAILSLSLWFIRIFPSTVYVGFSSTYAIGECVCVSSHLRVFIQTGWKKVTIYKGNTNRYGSCTLGNIGTAHTCWCQFWKDKK